MGPPKRLLIVEESRLPINCLLDRDEQPPSRRRPPVGGRAPVGRGQFQCRLPSCNPRKLASDAAQYNTFGNGEDISLHQGTGERCAGQIISLHTDQDSV